MSLCSEMCRDVFIDLRRPAIAFIPKSETCFSDAWNKIGNRPSVSLCRGVNYARGKSVAENRSSNVIVLPHRRRTRWRLAALRWWPHRDTHQPELPPASTISDYDLHAFVDNALDAVRRKRVQAFLAQHPALAADAAAYSRQNRMLRALKRPPKPSSPALGYLAVQLTFRLTRGRIARAAACCVAAAVIAFAGWSFISGDWVVVSRLIVAAGW